MGCMKLLIVLVKYNWITIQKYGYLCNSGLHVVRPCCPTLCGSYEVKKKLYVSGGPHPVSGGPYLACRLLACSSELSRYNLVKTRVLGKFL